MKFTVNELERVLVVGRMLQAGFPQPEPPEFETLITIQLADAFDAVWFQTDTGFFLNIAGDQFRRGISPLEIYNEAKEEAYHAN